MPRCWAKWAKEKSLSELHGTFPGRGGPEGGGGQAPSDQMAAEIARLSAGVTREKHFRAGRRDRGSEREEKARSAVEASL